MSMSMHNTHRNAERAGHCIHMEWLRIRRDILVAKVPPEDCEVSTPCQNSQSKVPEPGRGAHIASGSENQQGLCPPERGKSLLESALPISYLVEGSVGCSQPEPTVQSSKDTGGRPGNLRGWKIGQRWRWTSGCHGLLLICHQLRAGRSQHL